VVALPELDQGKRVVEETKMVNVKDADGRGVV